MAMSTSTSQGARMLPALNQDVGKTLIIVAISKFVFGFIIFELYNYST
jgi:hypothetical protein